MATYNSFSALSALSESLTSSEPVYNDVNNYGVDSDIVNILEAGYQQLMMDEEVIRYDKWFLNRPINRHVNGEIINISVIKEAKNNAKMALDAMAKDEKRAAGLAKEARKAAKRLLNKEIKMEMETAKMVKLSGMTDMEFIGGDTIICHEDKMTITVNRGYISVAINKSTEKCTECSTITPKQGGSMGNYTSDEFGPQRYCRCHNGVTEELLQETMDELGVQFPDEHPKTQTMDEELQGSRTKLEEFEDGFICPVCGAIYDTTNDVHDGHYDTYAFMMDEDKPLYTPFADDTTGINKCKSISLVVNEYTDINQLKSDILTACNGDIYMAECMAEMIVTETEMDKDMTDGIGRDMISYVEDITADDYDDDGEAINYSDNNMINVEQAADKLIPWLGETVNILGMLDIVDRSGNKLSDGVFTKLYKTSHDKLGQHILDKASIAKKNILALRDTVVEGDTVISKTDAEYLLSELTHEYDYWMSWVNDDEWSGYKTHQFIRSNAIDHVIAGGELKYYKYTNANGEVTFGYHPDSYTKDGVNYVDGSMRLVQEVTNSDRVNELAKVVSDNDNNWWSGYEYNGVWYVNAMIYNGDKAVVAFKGKATKEIVEFFRSTTINHIKNNTSRIIDNSAITGVKVDYNFYYFTNDLINIFNVDAKATLKRRVSSNKWLADIDTNCGNDVKRTTLVAMINK